MLAAITILTALAFAAMYPLCFLISADDPLKNQFHKFHIAAPNTVGGMVLVFTWLMDIPLDLKITVTVWKVIFLSVSWFSWKKEYPSPVLMAIPCVLGIFTFIRLQCYFVAPGSDVAFIGVLSGLIFCISLYAMNLGHWYLNVHGLPAAHLMRTIYIFAGLLTVRFLWDLYFLCQGTVVWGGEAIGLTQFVTTIEGFLVLIGLFFGTVFPLLSLHFAKEVLKLKNTQSATGILYVILCAILIGDITYKYYMIKYGVVL